MTGYLPRLILAVACTVSIPYAAPADVSTDRPGAILIFPKVASDRDRETIIQISNNIGARVFLRCFYTDGRSELGGGEPAWLVTDFNITLTQLQPTVWLAGEGLPAVPPDRPDDLYPGPVPPVTDGFEGTLRCVVVDAAERPVGVNALTGEATIVDRQSGLSRKYSAVSVRGFAANNGDNVLMLNESEYGACPRILMLNHFFDGAPDPVRENPVSTRLTVVPCSMDIENSIPGSATLQFEVFNEFEQRLSTSMGVDCYADVALSAIDRASQPELSIFSFALQGTVVGLSRIRSVVDSRTDTGRGVVALAEEWREGGAYISSVQVHYIGGSLQSDVMVLSEPF